jgi:hypothetical protein
LFLLFAKVTMTMQKALFWLQIILPPSQLHLLGTCVSLPDFSARTDARENPEKKPCLSAPWLNLLYSSTIFHWWYEKNCQKCKNLHCYYLLPCCFSWLVSKFCPRVCNCTLVIVQCAISKIFALSIFLPMLHVYMENARQLRLVHGQ